MELKPEIACDLLDYNADLYFDDFKIKGYLFNENGKNFANQLRNSSTEANLKGLPEGLPAKYQMLNTSHGLEDATCQILPSRVRIGVSESQKPLTCPAQKRKSYIVSSDNPDGLKDFRRGIIKQQPSFQSQNNDKGIIQRRIQRILRANINKIFQAKYASLRKPKQ